MEIRSSSDWHTASFAENVKEGRSMHQISNSTPIADAINEDIKQSLIKGQQEAAKNSDPANVTALMGKGTALNIMA